MYRYILVFSLMLGMYNCGYFNSSNATDNDLTFLSESGIMAATTAADDLILASVGTTSIDEQVSANEFTCTGNWSACNTTTGVKTRAVACTNPAVSYTKEITLSYFNSLAAIDTTCSGIATTGNYIMRSGSDILSIPSFGTFTSTSDASTGGVQLYKNADGTISMSIKSVTTTFTSNDSTTARVPNFTHSVHSDPSAPLILSKIARDGRTIKSGTLISEHLVAGFTSTMEFSNLLYYGNCCYPIAGSIKETLSGNRTGVATINFSNICGTATLVNERGVTITMSMVACMSSLN